MTSQSVSSRGEVFLKGQIVPTPRKRFIDAVHDWRCRIRSRRELAALSSLELKDLGYPAGAEAEKFKPFWRT